MDRNEAALLFEKYIKKLRITPAWDVRLEFVDDPAWPKTGDFKIDCDDRKAILLLNAADPKQENIEEVIVHELMHIKMYPLDQVTESLITSCFEEGSAVEDHGKMEKQGRRTALRRVCRRHAGPGDRICGGRMRAADLRMIKKGKGYLWIKTGPK